MRRGEEDRSGETEVDRPLLKSQPSLSQRDDDDDYSNARIRVGQEFQCAIPSIADCKPRPTGKCAGTPLIKPNDVKKNGPLMQMTLYIK